MTARTSIALVPPPAYLREVPSRLLVGRDYSPDAVLACLQTCGIAARPTLAEIEAERARRGVRRQIVLAEAPASVPVVLSMGTSADRAAKSTEEARQNRARVVAALGGVSATADRARTRSRRRTSTPRDPLARIAVEVGARVA